ncbi:MAG: NUDIX hydrolase [Desulfobulbaceae bacterium A2]|nr:MAG: NUDIX hydrolase [Desulfobulbaceae bacterium A2]
MSHSTSPLPSAGNCTARHLQVTCAFIERSGLVLAARRGPAMAMAGKWEFPGGKIEAGETATDCLRRELMEELAINARIGPALTPHTHHYSGRLTVTLHPFLCTIEAGEPLAHEHDRLLWLPPAELSALDWAAADLPVLAEYLARR